MLTRRSLVTGLIGIVAAPAIVRYQSIMKVSAPKVVMPPRRLYKQVGNVEEWAWQVRKGVDYWETLYHGDIIPEGVAVRVLIPASSDMSARTITKLV